MRNDITTMDELNAAQKPITTKLLADTLLMLNQAKVTDQTNNSKIEQCIIKIKEIQARNLSNPRDALSANPRDALTVNYTLIHALSGTKAKPSWLDEFEKMNDGAHKKSHENWSAWNTYDAQSRYSNFPSSGPADGPPDDTTLLEELLARHPADADPAGPDGPDLEKLLQRIDPTNYEPPVVAPQAVAPQPPTPTPGLAAAPGVGAQPPTPTPGLAAAPLPAGGFPAPPLVAPPNAIHAQQVANHMPWDIPKAEKTMAALYHLEVTPQNSGLPSIHQNSVRVGVEVSNNTFVQYDKATHQISVLDGTGATIPIGTGPYNQAMTEIATHDALQNFVGQKHNQKAIQVSKNLDALIQIPPGANNPSSLLSPNAANGYPDGSASCYLSQQANSQLAQQLSLPANAGQPPQFFIQKNRTTNRLVVGYTDANTQQQWLPNNSPAFKDALDLFTNDPALQASINKAKLNEATAQKLAKQDLLYHPSIRTPNGSIIQPNPTQADITITNKNSDCSLTIDPKTGTPKTLTYQGANGPYTYEYNNQTKQFSLTSPPGANPNPQPLLQQASNQFLEQVALSKPNINLDHAKANKLLSQLRAEAALGAGATNKWGISDQDPNKFYANISGDDLSLSKAALASLKKDLEQQSPPGTQLTDPLNFQIVTNMQTNEIEAYAFTGPNQSVPVNDPKLKNQLIQQFNNAKPVKAAIAKVAKVETDATQLMQAYLDTTTTTAQLGDLTFHPSADGKTMAIFEGEIPSLSDPNPTIFLSYSKDKGFELMRTGSSEPLSLADPNNQKAFNDLVSKVNQNKLIEPHTKALQTLQKLHDLPATDGITIDKKNGRVTAEIGVPHKDGSTAKYTITHNKFSDEYTIINDKGQGVTPAETAQVLQAFNNDKAMAKHIETHEAWKKNPGQQSTCALLKMQQLQAIQEKEGTQDPSAFAVTDDDGNDYTIRIQKNADDQDELLVFDKDGNQLDPKDDKEAYEKAIDTFNKDKKSNVTVERHLDKQIALEKMKALSYLQTPDPQDPDTEIICKDRPKDGKFSKSAAANVKKQAPVTVKDKKNGYTFKFDPAQPDNISIEDKNGKPLAEGSGEYAAAMDAFNKNEAVQNHIEAGVEPLDAPTDAKLHQAQSSLFQIIALIIFAVKKSEFKQDMKTYKQAQKDVKELRTTLGKTSDDTAKLKGNLGHLKQSPHMSDKGKQRAKEQVANAQKRKQDLQAKQKKKQQQHAASPGGMAGGPVAPNV